MRRISGSTATSRAMHSRCCCSPESAEGVRVEPVLELVPEVDGFEASVETRLEDLAVA